MTSWPGIAVPGLTSLVLPWAIFGSTILVWTVFELRLRTVLSFQVMFAVLLRFWPITFAATSATRVEKLIRTTSAVASTG